MAWAIRRRLTLVSIASDLNVNDKTASQDKIELEGKLNEYYEKLGTITTAILESDLGGEAIERWGQEYADDARRGGGADRRIGSAAD